MELTREEERKNKAISAGVTIAITALLLLLLLLFQIITPNPPFPESGGGGGQELALGMMTVGNDDIDYTSMGAVTNVVTENNTTQEKIVTAEGGEQVDVRQDEEKPVVKEDKVVINPVPPKPEVKPKTAAEKLAEKFRKQSGKSGGGIGDNEDPGQSGAPDGSPSGGGSGGSGTGDGGGTGEGDGPGSGPGSGGIGGGGGIGIDLRGRTVVVPPKLPKDTKEEGKVVVEILVDSEGNVIEASPNGRGTTTSSPTLKAKARQAALATKFNVNGKFEEQKGTITIIFSFN